MVTGCSPMVRYRAVRHDQEEIKTKINEKPKSFKTLHVAKNAHSKIAVIQDHYQGQCLKKKWTTTRTMSLQLQDISALQEAKLLTMAMPQTK